MRKCSTTTTVILLADAETFADLASCEIRRRGVVQAQAVAAINDGAVWIQGFVQGQRADAVRILDFARADESAVSGSGLTECGNKLVVQVRLKGVGMRWDRHRVNAMLDLCTTLCSDRWTQS
jgi:hypothetical protein